MDSSKRGHTDDSVSEVTVEGKPVRSEERGQEWGKIARGIAHVSSCQRRNVMKVMFLKS